jgi:hypothetical protein
MPRGHPRTFCERDRKALALGGTVTTDATTITVPNCAPFLGAGTDIPTISERMVLMLAALLAVAGIVAIRRRRR